MTGKHWSSGEIIFNSGPKAGERLKIVAYETDLQTLQFEPDSLRRIARLSLWVKLLAGTLAATWAAELVWWLL